MKKIILALMCLGGALPALAQYPLNPKYLVGGLYICDDQPWKLVFEDHFDGDVLKEPWISFNSWYGISWPGFSGDHPFWNDARYREPYNSIYKDDNVYVSNGTVKLMVSREEVSLDTNYYAPGDPLVHAPYSTSTIALPYIINGTNRSFNSGKFEARIRMPKFKFAHSTMWLWPGENSVDRHHPEADIAEAYGVGKNGSLFGHQPHCNFVLHNWPPGDLLPNPYDLQREQTPPIVTHNGQWGDWFFGNLFDIGDWHTYRYEWDSARVQWWVDDIIDFELWKFYRWKSFKKWYAPWKTYYYKEHTTCNIPESDNWNIEPSFPYDWDSKSQLRFTTAIDKDDPNTSGQEAHTGDHEPEHGTGWLGEMEIDYVKIWQRRIHNGWADMNGPQPATINGPDIICNIEQYTATPPGPTGAWDASPSTNIWLQGGNTSANVHWSQYSNRTDAVFGYLPGWINNPEVVTYKTVDAGKSLYSTAIVSKTISGSECTYQLAATGTRQVAGGTELVPYHSPHTFEWDIDYGPGLSLHHHTFGQYVSVPPFPYSPGQPLDKVKWKLKITNACGLAALEGGEIFAGFKVVGPRQTNSLVPGLTVVAYIDDPDAYSKSVQNRLNYTSLPEKASDMDISSAIEKIELEALAPYLVLDSANRQGARAAVGTPRPQSPLLANTTVYPVPAHQHLNIRLSTRYTEGQPIRIRLLDQTGRAIREQSMIYQTGAGLTMDVSGAAPGFYNLIVRQGPQQECMAVAVQSE